MVYSIDSMHLKYGHVYYADFSSTFCVQQGIIPERLNQIYIAVHCHRRKEEILSFPMVYHTRKSVTSITFYVSEKARSKSIGLLYLRLVLINQR